MAIPTHPQCGRRNKFRETPEYSNTGNWVVRDCYFTAIRDDSVENDRFEPGTVQDCLFDGVHTFISEQNENVGSKNPIGLNEDPVIYVTRVYVRLYPTNGETGAGKWFNGRDAAFQTIGLRLGTRFLQLVPCRDGAGRTWTFHRNSHGWGPKITFFGSGNPGRMVARGQAVTFLEGPAAEYKWVQVRNKWLTAHGLPAQDFPADYNPHLLPVERIPLQGATATDGAAPVARQ